MQATPQPQEERRSRLLRGLVRGAVALAVIATTSLVATGTASADALEISGLTPINYTEGGDPVPVAPDVVITGGGTFADGYVEFGVADPQPDDRLFLPEAESPDSTEDAITVIGRAVYLGLGSTYKQIGTVNNPNDGQNGRPLRIDFSAALTNSSFDDGLTGWTINQNLVKLGALARKSQGRPVTVSGSGPYTVSGTGYSFQTDKRYAGSVMPGWGYESVERNTTNISDFSAGVTANGSHSSALQLSFDVNCESGSPAYCSVFGPDAWSSPFEAKAGDDLAFDWSANGGSDDYEVYGFLVNESAAPGTPAVDTHTELMYGRGEHHSWSTSTGKIPADGTYRFRFVTGSYDATGGLALGASLYIDDVRVLSSDATAAVAQSVAREVHFENTGNNPRSEISIGVSAKSSDGTSAPATVPVETALVDDAPVLADITGVGFTNDVGDTTFTNQTGTASATDPEGDPVTYSIDGGTAETIEIAGVTYTDSLTGPFGTLHLNRTSGKFVVVPDGQALNSTVAATTANFTIVATASGLSSSKDLTVSVAIAASLPGEPTGLVVTNGDRSVDLSWAAPAWLGGDITGYKIESSVDGVNWDIVTADTGSSDTSVHVDGLDNGHPVQFRVTAINASGTGLVSAGITGSPRTAPDAPTITSIVNGNKMLTVNFSAPDFDGGAEITNYEYSVDGGVTWQERRIGTTESPLIIGPLNNGTTFPVMIRAVNVAGGGQPSNQIAATPVAAAVLPSSGGPAAPTGSAVLLVDGQPSPVEITRPPVGPGVPAGTLRFSDDDFSVDLFGIGENGRSLELDSEGRLVLVAGAFAEASGHGFLPGSSVDVWLMSTPILLGTITVRADGTFSAKLPVPAGIEPGPHTIQLNGVGADNKLKTLSVGVVVRAAKAAAAESGAKPVSAQPSKPGSGRTSDPAAKKLAMTGGYAGLMSALGLTLLVAGSAISTAGRKRRQSVL